MQQNFQGLEHNLQNKWLALVKDCSCPSQSVKMFYSKKINYLSCVETFNFTEWSFTVTKYVPTLKSVKV